jgi:hypothetical protein
VSFLALNLSVKADEIDTIVKQSIAQAAPQNAKALPCEVQKHSCDCGPDCDCGPGCKCKPKATSNKRSEGCACGPDCDCDGCKCKPGYKCDSYGCKKLKGSEAPVERCWVIIDDVKIFTIQNVTASEAMASIKAQGNKVVFIDSNNTVVDPPSWYVGKVALSHSMVQKSYSGGEFIKTQPLYVPSQGFGFGAGMNFGRFSAQACIGST